MKKKLVILQGPPCSGKSTFAAKLAKENFHYYIINRDTIRYKVGEGKYTMDKEDEVTKIENELMEMAYSLHYNIIMDNTNLNPKTIDKLENWAKEHDYEVEYNDFYIPYAEAMKRSKKRRDEGGLYITRDVMRRFYRKYYNDKFEEEMTDSRIKYVNQDIDESKPYCVICDLDGTVALHNKREPFEWDKIPSDVFDDKMQVILYALNQLDIEIIFLTGRPEIQGNTNVRELTEKWLEDNDFHNYTLIMRDTKDFRSGEIVKKEQYEKHIKDKYNVISVFDDSNKCVEMWRNENLLCLQPETGDY